MLDSHHDRKVAGLTLGRSAFRQKPYATCSHRCIHAEQCSAQMSNQVFLVSISDKINGQVDDGAEPMCVYSVCYNGCTLAALCPVHTIQTRHLLCLFLFLLYACTLTDVIWNIN